MNRQTILDALRKQRGWFLNSGVLSQGAGFWGVAERILLTDRNEALQEALDSFPSWSAVPEGYVIEQRRADCNFECAWYFLKLSALFDREQNRQVAKNLLEYLYCRSGLLSHHKIDEPYPVGCWNWSHIRWTPSVYYDDNAWCVMLALAIAEKEPEWDSEFQMSYYALEGAKALHQAFQANFLHRPDSELQKWNGNLELPHWGALLIAALGCAWKLASEAVRAGWSEDLHAYLAFIEKGLDAWNPSELSYSLLAAAICARVPEIQPVCLALGRKLADRMLSLVKPGSCLLPAEHYEAPAGEELADLIYTMNFAAAAFNQFLKVVDDRRYQSYLSEVTEFLIAIQDNSPSPRLSGCWRGMYDAGNQVWGGGNHSEGGAGSIYTGWTNAPIGWVLADMALEEVR